MDGTTGHLSINRPSVFNRVYWPLYHNPAFMQVVYGGASSGKSTDIAQRYVLDLVEQPERNILAVRNVANTLRQSCYAEICKAITRFKLKDYFDCNESALCITCKLWENQVYFRGLDDPQKLKSITPRRGVFTDLWMEEAVECARQAFYELLFRLRGRANVKKKVTLSFNPIYRNHWIARELLKGIEPELGKFTYLDGGETLVLRTNYTHNLMHLDAQDVRIIESYNDPNDAAKQYWWRVYGLGEWGVLGDVIFTNWAAENLSELQFSPDECDFGLDFGYSSDPAAFVQTCIRGDTIYVPHGIYQTGLTNPELAAEIKPYCGDEIVWADSAEPKSIRELRTDPDNKINARGVQKGKDSVRHRVQWLQQKRIVADESLQWFINELNTYAWAKDKVGQPMHPPKPIDAFNHGIDALGYANERRIRRGRGMSLGTSAGTDEGDERGVLRQLTDEQSNMSQKIELARR